MRREGEQCELQPSTCLECRASHQISTAQCRGKLDPHMTMLSTQLHIPTPHPTQALGHTGTQLHPGFQDAAPPHEVRLLFPTCTALFVASAEPVQIHATSCCLSTGLHASRICMHLVAYSSW